MPCLLEQRFMAMFTDPAVGHGLEVPCLHFHFWKTLFNGFLPSALVSLSSLFPWCFVCKICILFSSHFVCLSFLIQLNHTVMLIQFIRDTLQPLIMFSSPTILKLFKTFTDFTGFPLSHFSFYLRFYFILSSIFFHFQSFHVGFIHLTITLLQ